MNASINQSLPQSRLKKIIKKIVKGIAWFIAFCITGIIICLTLLWLEHKQRVTLPLPTGQFAVGRTTYHWVDSSRTDSLAPIKNQKRELVIWIWYPAGFTKAAKASEYMPKNWRTAIEEHQGPVLRNFLKTDLSITYAHSINNANLVSGTSSFPIVILRSGIGALALDYTSFAEDLASHGYVVIGADAPYSTTVVVLPDGRVIKRPGENEIETMPAERRNIFANKLINVWAADTKFMLDKLTELNENDPSGKFAGRLNLQSVGIMGHSFGGATAAQFCHDDDRCKAGIDLDGIPFGTVVDEGTDKPFMFLTSDYGSKKYPVTIQFDEKVKSVYDHLPENTRLWIKLKGMRHFNFSDGALLNDSHIGRLTGLMGSIGERRGLAITSSCVLDFFDVYLKKAANSQLKKTLLKLPEVEIKKD